MNTGWVGGRVRSAYNLRLPPKASGKNTGWPVGRRPDFRACTAGCQLAGFRLAQLSDALPLSAGVGGYIYIFIYIYIFRQWVNICAMFRYIQLSFFDSDWTANIGQII